MSEIQAIQTLLTLIDDLGLGFHPDTPIADYVGESGTPTYSANRAAELQRELDQCFEAFDDVYGVAIGIWQHKGLIPVVPRCNECGISGKELRFEASEMGISDPFCCEPYVEETA